MDKWVEILEDLQSTYAASYKLTLRVFESDGSPLTRFSEMSAITRLIVGHQDDVLTVKRILERDQPCSHSIIYDVYPGIKAILSPIWQNDSVVNYLWAGCFIEETDREIIKSYFNANMESPQVWELALDGLDGINHTEREELFHKVETLANIISVYLNAKQSKQISEHRLDVVEDLLKSVCSEEPTSKDLLCRFASITPFVDFIGYAKYDGNVRFRVTELHYGAPHSLIGTSFTLGEGYLGQVAATGQSKHWIDIENDSRSGFFRDHMIRLTQLCVFPVFSKEKVIGVLFGGNTKKKAIDSHTLKLFKNMSLLLGLHLTNQILRTEQSNYRYSIKLLTEIARAMSEVSDAETILFMLVEMSLSLTGGRYSCLVVRVPEFGRKMRVVSRGMLLDDADDYGKDLTEKYLINDNRSLPDAQGIIEPNRVSLEYPIVSRGQVRAVLAVGLESSEDIERHRSLLESLSIIGGLSLQCVDETPRLPIVPHVIKALHRGIRQWDATRYQFSEALSEFSVSFAHHMGMDPMEINTLRAAALIFPYEIETLKDVDIDESIINILSHFAMLVENFPKPTKRAESINLTAKILAISACYLNQSYTLVHGFVEDELWKQLSAFTNVQPVQSKSIPKQHINDRHIEYSESVQNKYALTTRERQILALVLEASTNRDIATALNISEHTVKNHLSNIFRKLGVSDRSEAIAVMYRQFMDESDRIENGFRCGVE